MKVKGRNSDKVKLEGYKEEGRSVNIIMKEIQHKENGIYLKFITGDSNKNKEEVVRVTTMKEVAKMNKEKTKELKKELKEAMKKGKKNLKDVVKSISKEEVNRIIIKDKQAILDHIKKMEEFSDSIKTNKSKKNNVKTKQNTNIKQSSEHWDEFTADVTKLMDDQQQHIVNDLDSYIKRVVELPEDEVGVKQVQVLDKYLRKISVKDNSKLSEEDINKINEIVKHEPIDYEGLVSICKGHEYCGNISCPLYKIGKEPIGERCPIEEAYVEKLIKEYLDQILLDEYDVIGIVEYNLIINLVECDLVDWRLRNQFNVMGYLIDDISVDPKTGGKVVNKKHNPLLEIRKQNDNRKISILKSLLATPEIKRRLNIKSNRKNDRLLSESTSDNKIKSIIDKTKEHRKLLTLNKKTGKIKRNKNIRK